MKINVIHNIYGIYPFRTKNLGYILYQKKNLVSLKTVGYSELFDFLDGKLKLEEAVELIKRNSRRYAKRQITWFKRESNYQWLNPNNIENIIKEIDLQ